MAFAGINHLAVLIAAVAGFAFGAVYYIGLSKQWLAAAGKRLDAMLQAVKLVSSALDDFYATLSDEQKAQFEAIGPSRTPELDRRQVRG